jgi:hypothetical protein
VVVAALSLSSLVVDVASSHAGDCMLFVVYALLPVDSDVHQLSIDSFNCNGLERTRRLQRRNASEST